VKHSEGLVDLLSDLDAVLTNEQRSLLRQLHQMTTRLESANGDFQVVAIVSASTGEAKVDVVWLEQLAQVAPVKAREIAWMLLEAASVAEADAGLMRFMRSEESGVGLSPEAASRMLAELREFRVRGSLLGTSGH
jgi:hypothetical protein